MATMSSAHILARNFVATKSGGQETKRQPDATRRRPLLERKSGRTQRPFVDHFSGIAHTNRKRPSLPIRTVTTVDRSE